MEEISLILLGLVIGSFLNVVILRLPKGENIVSPRSRCPQCQAPIAFYDNIPLLSYLILRGKCRHCRRRISLQYPLVEAFTAISFWLVQDQYPLSDWPLYTALACLFISLLIALALIDLRHMILPDILTLGGAAVYLAVAVLIALLKSPPQMPAAFPGLLDSLLTAFAAAAIFAGLFFYYLKVRKIEGLGFGDIKMIFFLGLFLGHRNLIIAILIASISGLLAGLYFILFKKKNLKYALPFGTFLSIGSYIALFWGEAILFWLKSVTGINA